MNLGIRRGQPTKGIRFPRTLRYGRHRAQRVVFDSNVEVAPELVVPSSVEEINFNSWTVTQLKDYLDLLAVSYPSGALKAELVALAEATI